MSAPERGLYEALITEELEARLANLDERYQAKKGHLNYAEAPDRIALHISRIIQWALASVPAKERVTKGVELARGLIDHIDGAITAGAAGEERPIKTGEILHAIGARLPDGSTEDIASPLIPLLDTTLLTNSPDEPRVGSQLLTEIHSADGIDIVMAFIRRTGIRPMIEALRTHCEQGHPLRVLTTSYTGSTELAALDQLAKLGAEIRVSYDTTTSRLHAKAWLFHRESGFSTAYIGSSNLTFRPSSRVSSGTSAPVAHATLMSLKRSRPCLRATGSASTFVPSITTNSKNSRKEPPQVRTSSSVRWNFTPAHFKNGFSS
jgi:hypothetical protein